ncbi:MAG: chemotaxis protein CheW [Bacteriovoracaceae bacterium]
MNNPANAIVQEFLVESFENLSNISEELTRYEQSPKDKELLNAIYRKVHTLKGSASFLGFKNLEKITHIVENTLDKIREDQLKLNASIMDVILESFDECQEILKSIERTGKEIDKDYSYVFDNLKNLEKDEEVIVEGEKPILGDILLFESEEKLEVKQKASRPSNVSDKSGAEVKVDKKSVSPVAKIEPAKATVATPISSDNHVESTSDSSLKTTANINDSTVRVNVKLLDKIMNVVGELVINRNQILQYSKKNDDAELNRFAQELNVITTELQTDIMTTRMQPVGLVFTKFERIVRDLGRSQGKKIKLEIQGQDTELDKTLIEVIKDPMTHLVRNSIDHGLETPEERIKNHKPETGNLIIKAYHEGGQVIIEISDDGKGINCAKVLEKAIAKGLVTAEEAVKLSPQKIVNFIFHAGFSTAEKVTNISGRGVGMDVVKSNIEKIGGEVEVISKEGYGATFRLKIPLTLAIVPALVVESCNETFAIHQKNLVELVMLDETELDKIERIHGNEFFRLRGDLIPIFRLNTILKMTCTESESHMTNIVVLKAEGIDYGLVVDNVLDTQEIVVKPLSRKLKNQSLYAGATIMGDGRVALIIDAYGFYNVIDHADKQELEMSDLQPERDNYNADIQEYLLCSLADKSRYAIPLCLINRLEEFKPKQIEWSGKQAVVRYRDVPMPLVNIEKILGITEKSPLDHYKDYNSLSCVVISIQGHLVGLIVEEILDIGLTEEEIDTEAVDRDGLLGVVYINEKLTSIIDIHKIIEKTKLIKKTEGVRAASLGKGGRILVVEDSPLYRKIQEELLTSHGLDVAIARNGQEGVDYLRDGNKVDLILTDIEMPIMDGWQMAKEIRTSNRPYSEIPIVAVSTRYSEKDIARGKECGFSRHLQKLNRDEVISVIAEFIK